MLALKITIVLVHCAGTFVSGFTAIWPHQVFLSLEDSLEDTAAVSSYGEEIEDGVISSWESSGESQDRDDEAEESYTLDDKSMKYSTGSRPANERTTSKSHRRSSGTNCRRLPQRGRESLIGDRAFRALCEYFGARVRDEIMSGLEVVLERRGVGGGKAGDGYDHGKAYAMAFEIQKPALASCLENALDYYSNRSAGRRSTLPLRRYPACLQRLAINPEPDFQIVWLKNFPRLVAYFERVVRGQRIFDRASLIVQNYLNRGLINRWTKVKALAWARAKLRAWRNSKIEDRVERIRNVLQERPALLDICKLTKDTTIISSVNENSCLKKILANLVVLEALVQEDGATLEYEFIGGKPLALNLLYVVKKALEKKRTAWDTKRYQDKLANQAKHEIYDLRMSNIRCANDLRRTREYEMYEEWISGEKIKTCLKVLSLKIARLLRTALKLYGPEIMRSNNARHLRTVAMDLLKKIMDSYQHSKFLMPIIQRELDSGVLETDLSGYPWAKHFIDKWRSSSIEDKYERLETIYHSIVPSTAERSCLRLINEYEIVKNDCWRRYIDETLIVELELMKNGLSLQMMYMGDPFLMNLVYFAEDSLKKYLRRLDSEAREIYRPANFNESSSQMKKRIVDHEVSAPLKDDHTESSSDVANPMALKSEPLSLRNLTIRLGDGDFANKVNDELAKQLANMIDTTALKNTIRRVM